MLLTLHPERVLVPGFMGFGAQLDPFIEHPMGVERWERLWRRVDRMRLRLVRCLVPVSAFAPNGALDLATPAMAELYRLLDELRRRDITTIWGIWSEGTQFDGKSDPRLHEAFADAAAHLLLQRGYACIRYLNLFSDPNYGRSFRAGNPADNYGLWADAIRHADALLAARGVSRDRARLIGPHNNAGDWHRRAVEDLHAVLGAYATHVYPRDALVCSGPLEPTWRAARQRAIQHDPGGFHKPFILGECGLNDDRGEDDRQWHVRKYWYGLAMADLAAQALRAGLAGAIYWMLDDAMHPRRLWGLWDSTGAYDRDGEPRPVCYAWTLLSRCFLPGAQIIEVEDGGHEGFRAAAARAGDHWSILLVNRREENLALSVRFPRPLGGLMRYEYLDGPRAADAEGFPLPASENLKTDSAGGLELCLPPQTATIISTLGTA